MSSSYLRVTKQLKLLKDGSSMYSYHNGCKSTTSLFLKDIVNHPVWSPQKSIKSEKSIHPNLEKYIKKFSRKKNSK